MTETFAQAAQQLAGGDGWVRLFSVDATSLGGNVYYFTSEL